MNFAASKTRNWWLSKLLRCTTVRHDKIAPFSATGFLEAAMETSQIKQSIVDLTERTDALRRYL
jgi:hypothetical protein